MLRISIPQRSYFNGAAGNAGKAITGFQSLKGLILTSMQKLQVSYSIEFQSLKGLILTLNEISNKLPIYYISIPQRSYFNRMNEVPYTSMRDISIPQRSYFNT